MSGYLPTAQVRALVTLLGSEEMTPTASRYILRICDEADRKAIPGTPDPQTMIDVVGKALCNKDGQRHRRIERRDPDSPCTGHEMDAYDAVEVLLPLLAHPEHSPPCCVRRPVSSWPEHHGFTVVEDPSLAPDEVRLLPDHLTEAKDGEVACGNVNTDNGRTCLALPGHRGPHRGQLGTPVWRDVP